MKRLMLILLAAACLLVPMSCETGKPVPSAHWPRPAQPKAGMISVAEAKRAAPAGSVAFVAWEGVNPRPRGAKGRTVWTWRARDAEGRVWRVENVRRADGTNLRTKMEECQ